MFSHNVTLQNKSESRQSQHKNAICFVLYLCDFIAQPGGLVLPCFQYNEGPSMYRGHFCVSSTKMQYVLCFICAILLRNMKDYCCLVFNITRVPACTGEIFACHYENTPMQHTTIFHGCKNDSFQLIYFYYFHIFAQIIDCW